MIGKIANLVAEAEKDRKKDFEDEEKAEYVEIADEIYKLLRITPVFNSIIGF